MTLSQPAYPRPPSRLCPSQWPREAIARRARELWERAGYPVGRDEEFWIEAEHRLFGGDAGASGRNGGGSSCRSDRWTRHILIVDDHTRVGWTWAAALRRAGFRISIAADADAGWSTLGEREFAMLITSQDSVGRRSLELINKVRCSSRRMPCILVREHAGDLSSRVQRLLRPGVVVERKVSIMDLLAVVRRLLAAAEDPGYVPVSATWGITP